jgi:hypothetical protein
MRWFTFAGLVLIIVAAAAIYFVDEDQTSFYEGALPSQLQTQRGIEAGSNFGLLGLLTLSREACGAVVFDLTPQTIADIRRQGLSFFAGARQARGHPSEPYYHYDAWQQTPAPTQWFGDGVVAGSLGCAHIDRELMHRIVTASRAVGGFYTTTPEAQLIVLPTEGIAVLTYDG